MRSRSILVSPTDCLLFLAVATLPLYFWDSGLPQVSHILLGIAILLQCMLMRKGFDLSLPTKILLVLFATSGLIDLSRSLFLGFNPNDLMGPVYVLFSAVSLSFFSKKLDTCPIIMKNAFLLSLAVATIGLLIRGVSLSTDSNSEMVYRSIGTFNNPNQLGYYGVCALSISFVLYWQRMISPLVCFAIILLSVFLVIASLSKAASISSIAAVVAFTVNLFPGFFAKIVFKPKAMHCIVLISLLGFATYYFFASGGLPLVDPENFKIFSRLSSIGSDSDDSLDGRGYWIIWNSGIFEILFGYGLSVVRALIGHELHSTFFSFFANYGLLVGSLYVGMFLSAYYKSAKSIGHIRSIIAYLPILLYGITHNGSRFTVLYLFIALAISLPASSSNIREDAFMLTPS
jgi:hypothetical protein